MFFVCDCAVCHQTHQLFAVWKNPHLLGKSSIWLDSSQYVILCSQSLINADIYFFNVATRPWFWATQIHISDLKREWWSFIFQVWNKKVFSFVAKILFSSPHRWRFLYCTILVPDANLSQITLAFQFCFIFCFQFSTD